MRGKKKTAKRNSEGDLEKKQSDQVKPTFASSEYYLVQRQGRRKRPARALGRKRKGGCLQKKSEAALIIFIDLNGKSAPEERTPNKSRQKRRVKEQKSTGE